MNKSDNKIIAYLLLAGALLFTAYVRLRLLNVPLERDEGEFGYIAQLILSGESPFNAYNYKIPGVSYLYAFFIKLFGNNAKGIHSGLLVVNLISITLIYSVTQKLLNNKLAGSIAAIFYAVLAMSPAMAGTAAHATHFVNVFALSAIACFVKYQESNKKKFLFLSFLFSGLAFTMKQPALAFIGLIFIGSILKQKAENKFSIIQLVKENILGGIIFAIPYLLIVLVALSHHQFDLFWKWTYVYPQSYASTSTISDGMINLKMMFPFVTGKHTLLWLIGGIGIILLIINKSIDSSKKIFIASWILISILTVIPGYAFRNHYFVMLIPVVAFLGAEAFYYLVQLLASKSVKYSLAIAVGIFLIISTKAISNQSNFLFKLKPEEFCRALYGNNPFIEAQQVSKFIQSKTTEKDSIAVLGSEAEIYFYSKRKAATGYLFTYEMGKMHAHTLDMQKEMMAEIEKNKPKLLVMVWVFLSWTMEQNAPKNILDWFGKYSQTNYHPIALVDMLPEGTTYKSDVPPNELQPKSQNFIVVFERNDK